MTKRDRISLAKLLVQVFGTKALMNKHSITRQAVHAWTFRGLPNRYVNDYMTALEKQGVFNDK